jgi:rubrerythrin
VSALEELERDPGSRKRFLKMMGGGGAAGALALFAAACGSSSSGKSTTAAAPSSSKTTKKSASAAMSGDLAILQYALTLEHLETDFYAKAAATGFFKGAQADTLKEFGAQEAQHVDALTATIKKLGGTPNAAPKAKFPLSDKTTIVKLAQRVENLGAAAYLGQAGNIENKEVLAAALSIHTVEARHAAVLNTLLGKSVTPDGAFAKPASMQQVLAVVKPFIVA